MLSRGVYPLTGSEEIDRLKFFHEEIFLGLRSTGIDTAKLLRLYGTESLQSSEEWIKTMEQEGLLHRQNSAISLTSKGYAICDEIAGKLIGEAFPGA